MRNCNRILIILSGIIHCSSFLAVINLSDFAIPGNIENCLLISSLLVGAVSCVVFCFYKARSIKHIMIRILGLSVCNILCVVLWGMFGIEDVLCKFIPLRHVAGENYASIFAIAMYFYVVSFFVLISFIIFLFVKLFIKLHDRGRFETTEKAGF